MKVNYQSFIKNDMEGNFVSEATFKKQVEAISDRNRIVDAGDGYMVQRFYKNNHLIGNKSWRK